MSRSSGICCVCTDAVGPDNLVQCDECDRWACKDCSIHAGPDSYVGETTQCGACPKWGRERRNADRCPCGGRAMMVVHDKGTSYLACQGCFRTALQACVGQGALKDCLLNILRGWSDLRRMAEGGE